MRRTTILALAAVVALLLSAAPGAAAPGFRTKVPPMLTLGPDAPAKSNIKAIVSSGDELFGFEFEGIPDGLGIVDHGTTVDVYVTHEQSHVAFPVASATTTGLRDYVDSSISKLTLNLGGKVLSASVALSPLEGFIRFCSAFMAGPAEGFDSPVFFANEESNDAIAVPAGALYGEDPFYGAGAMTRQAGYVVAYDVATGQASVIPGMGRHNHENTVVIPGGWTETVALSGDDTFNAPSSQLYLYEADSPADLLADGGQLFAFRVTGTNGTPLTDPSDPFNGANDYGDIADGDNWQGEFIMVPDGIADGTDPTEGGLYAAANPQDALERWSNANNVFQFIRVEDIAYDRNDPNVVYFADTGERRAIYNPVTGRLMRGPSTTVGPYPNGRIFRMELDPDDPLEVLSFSILRNDDPLGLSNLAAMHQPDNIETSANSLMVQEDSGQAPFSRIWRYDFATETWGVVAQVNDQDWESSGIVDASAAFGPGAWLVTVQAHDTFVDQSGPLVPNTTIMKREGGQLLLLRFPGS